MYMKYKPGDIGFSNNLVGILPKLIRLFTSYNTTSKIFPCSHTFVFQAPVQGEPSVQEASLHVQIVPFEKYYRDNPTELYRIYRVKSELADDIKISNSLKQIFLELSGQSYGILQLLWFPYRWFCQSILRKDVRKGNNWMSKGVICSENVYWYLYHLGPIFQDLLKDFGPDTIQAQDILDICHSNPQLFDLIDEKSTP